MIFKKPINLKNTLLVLAIVFMVHGATAQKLPKVQTQSVPAPKNIKVDGRFDEWEGGFQAYNTASRAFYTIANDNENLYLAVQMGDHNGTTKIFSGGLSFTIAPDSKRTINISFTYPGISKKATPESERLSTNSYSFKWYLVDTIANKKRIDSLVAASNSQMEKLFKTFYLTGTAEKAGKVISIYNEDGVSMKCRVDSKMRFCYELAIPLKYIAPYVAKTGKFNYNIKLNARPTVPAEGFSGDMVSFTNNEALDPDFVYTIYATDFSGEYTLAK